MTITLLRINRPFFVTLGLWDAPITISGAYRLLDGQIPHTDYQSPLGPVSFMIPTLGMLFLGYTMAGYQLGVLAFGFVCTTLTYFSLKNSGFSETASTFIAVFSATYILATRCFGYDFNHLGLISIYNIEGYLLLCFLLSESLCFTTRFPAAEKSSDTFWGAVGAIVAVGLVFLKITFGVAGLVIFALIFLKGGKSRQWTRGAISGLVFSGVFWTIFFRFELRSVVTDYLMALMSRDLSGSANEHSSNIHRLFSQPMNQIFSMLAAGLGVFYCLCAGSHRRIRFLILTIVVVGIEYFLMQTITQPPEFFLMGYFGLLAIGSNAMIKNLTATSRLSSLLACITLVFLGWNIGEKNIHSIRYFVEISKLSKNRFSPSTNEFLKSNNFADFYSSGQGVVMINELIGRQDICGAKKPAVITVGFPNLYSTMAGNPVAKHTPLYDHYGVTFSDRSASQFPDRLDSRRILHDLDAILIPTALVGDSTIKGFIRLHREYLLNNFNERIEFSNWRLFCKNQTPKAT